MKAEGLPVIDVHAHILPGVDDGAQSMEEACQLLVRAAEQGVCGVIATPHYSRRRAPQEYVQLLDQLRERIRQELPEFRLYLGQELYYYEGLHSELRQGKALTMAGSDYVLVEFDPGTTYQLLFQGIRQLSGAGYIPILAHMERYHCLRNPEHLRDLEGTGCWLQMNYESLEGRWYQQEVRWCRRQVLEGRIQLLGTDMHRMDTRPPRLEAAMDWLRKHVAPEALEKLVYDNAQQILKDGEASLSKFL